MGPISAITPELAELIRENKAVLINMLERSRDLPACKCCGNQQRAVQTFDGYENFECLGCNMCSGCRPGEAKEELLSCMAHKIAKSASIGSKPLQPVDQEVRNTKQQNLWY